MKIPGISLGFSNKQYSHNKSRDCNTTFPFGVTQPVFTEYMLPNSDIKVHAKQLVRLAPLVVPSFARVSLRCVTRFVPEHDVVPYADAFYSKMPFRTPSSSVIPKSLPCIDNPTLVAFLLSISNFTVWSYNPAISSTTPTYSPIARFQDLSAANLLRFYNLFLNGTSLTSSNVDSWPFKLQQDQYVVPSGSSATTAYSGYRPLPTPDSCDYVVFSSGGSTSSGAITLAFCFNFGQDAKNFRNICLGLGYSLDMDDFTLVRLTPLLAYYRAYFDTYGIQRVKNYTQTSNFWMTNYFGEYPSNFNWSVTWRVSTGGYIGTLSSLKNWLSDFCSCYYSSSSDFVSVHRDKLQIYNGSNQGFSVPVSGLVNSTTDATLANFSDDSDIRLTSNFNTISSAALSTLVRLSRFVNKNSLLGQRVSAFLKNHYGITDVSNVFEDSNFVYSSVLPCQINDVFSTSDTYNSESKDGEVLGAYAGKGIGFGDLSFSYHAKTHGYLITLASIVPESGYWQGNDFSLFALNWEQQPIADFDAVGMEVTPRSAFVSHNDISNRSQLGISDLTDKGFGFVPRYSGFKFAKNIVNGDMSRRGDIDSMSPYYLDRIICSAYLDVKVNSDSSRQVVYHSQPVPSGSYEWRYVTKYPWLGNFLRIFSNEVGELRGGSSSAVSGESYKYFCLDDSFLSQMSFDVTVRNFLKPLSLSYDTFSDDVDNASTSVNPA